MNLIAIRQDLATVAKTCGLNAWDYPPDDPLVLPCAVVGSPQGMRRMNKTVTEVLIPVTFYVSNADAQDAARRLDALLSIGVQDVLEATSYLDVLDAVHAEDGPAWRSITFEHAEPYELVSMPGDSTALACRIQLKLTA